LRKLWLLALPIGLAAAPASAGEVIVGAYAHDVATPITASGQENGLDLQLGWRGGRIGFLSFVGTATPHVYAMVNSAGDTNYASAGVSWKIGGKVYLRPGIGIAVHDGKGWANTPLDRIWFGSRLLFAPEIGAGLELSDRVSLEASWVHFSHGKFVDEQNPGSDNFGLRLNYRY
jgi:lipid A 3-O-deacylase